MNENWENHWKDYYQILQLDPSAEPDVIKAAHDKLALKYHPDVNKDSTATQRMKDINEAYEILSNAEKKHQYDLVYLQRMGKGSNSDFNSTFPSEKPKPEVYPIIIRFRGLKPGEIKESTFIVKNSGGSYSKIWLSNPSPWIKIVNQQPLSESGKLPLEVHIEAKGDEWGKTYTENIIVKLDDVETHVRVELETLAEPVQPSKVADSQTHLHVYKNRALKSTILKIIVPLSVICLLSTISVYFYFASKRVAPPQVVYPQMPSSSQPIQSIPAFRTLPLNVNWVGRKAESPDYINFLLAPNSSTQSNVEYGIQIKYRDTGASKTQINAAWNQQDIKSKKQLLLPVKATQDEINNYKLITAYWDGWNSSTQSQDFSVNYTYILVSINGMTEQQLVNQQNVFNSQYAQRLADRNSKAIKILYIFIPVDILLLFITLYTAVTMKSHSLPAPATTEINDGQTTESINNKKVSDALITALSTMDTTYKWYTNEDEATRELVSTLNAKGYNKEYNAVYHKHLGDGIIADAFLENSIIEAKLDPAKSEVDRLEGQLSEYLRYSYPVFVVLYGQIEPRLLLRIKGIISRRPDRTFLVYLPYAKRVRKSNSR